MKSCSLAARNILFISTTFCGKYCNRVCIARSREKGGMSIQVESELSPKGQKGVTLGEEWKKLFLEKVLGKEEHFPETESLCTWAKAWSKQSIIAHSGNCKSRKAWEDHRGRFREGPDDQGPCLLSST